jgi:hypothetical protein
MLLIYPTHRAQSFAKLPANSLLKQEIALSFRGAACTEEHE